METTLLNQETKRQTAGEPFARIAAALLKLAGTPGLALLQRYDARLHRNFQPALRTLIEVKELFPLVDGESEPAIP